METDTDGDWTTENQDLEKGSYYTYNDQGIRVSVAEKTDSDSDGELGDETATTTDYVIDDNNPTGYAQVLEEKNGTTGAVTKTYTLGHDVITQADDSSNIYHFLHDGHGSTRALLDTNGDIVSGQAFSFDAFGNPIGFDPANALTSLLYSGEQTDATGLQYLRARYYDPTSGRFNRLDPFAGNMSDPLTLHKYLYAHADAVNGIDPTGQFLLGGLLGGIGSLGFYNGAVLGAGYGMMTTVSNLVSAYTNVIMGAVQGYFGSDMGKREKVRKYLPYAMIAADVYGNGSGAPAGFVRLSSTQIPASVPNDIANSLTQGLSSGFHAGLYRKGSQYVLAFRGTDTRRDFITGNIPQGLGLPSSQYSMAAKVIRTLENTPPFKGNLTITGHSLGGGLAALASLVSKTRVSAVTFNPAGLHPMTLRRLGGEYDLYRAYQDITTFIVGNEILERADYMFGIPDSVGLKIYLDPVQVQGSFALHGMNSVIAAMEQLL